jgi:integrase-like protein
MNKAIPPRCRNHRLPTGCDTPTLTAASSLLSPRAISRQNKRSTSRRSDGAPGDFIADLPVNAFIHPAGRPINTSTLEVLRRPVESTQYTSFRFTAHLMTAGIDASIGTVGDAMDNALMESTIGLYKTELIKPRRPWHGLADVELATAEWVDWYNAKRLHSAIGHLPPNEHESLYYAQHQPREVVGVNC